MVELKTPAEVDAMAEAGAVVAQTLAAVREQAAAGVSLLELDDLGATVIAESGAKPAFLGHQESAPTPYPGVLCLSVNDAVVHGIPTGYRLRDGDLLSVDCGAFVDGWCGDAAISFVIGAATPADAHLIDTTADALRAGIAAAVPGARLGDVSAAIGEVGRAAGYGLLARHGGHGIGHAMHEDPHIPNEGRAGRGMILREGLTIALEPMFLAGGRDDYRTAADGWTLHSADGSRAAHIEHTIAVTADGPRVLTTC